MSGLFVGITVARVVRIVACMAVRSGFKAGDQKKLTTLYFVACKE